MQDEKMKILEMISEKKITAEEGAKLLDALESSNNMQKSNGGKHKLFRIRVSNLNTGKQDVNVNLPISLLNLGLKIGQHFAPDLKEQGVDLQEIAKLVNEGAEGKIVDVTDTEKNEKVEIWIE